MVYAAELRALEGTCAEADQSCSATTHVSSITSSPSIESFPGEPSASPVKTLVSKLSARRSMKSFRLDTTLFQSSPKACTTTTISDSTSDEGFLESKGRLGCLLRSEGYEMGEVMGRSSNRGFCVRLARRSPESAPLAVKITYECRTDGVLGDVLKREYDVLCALSHPRVVTAEGFLEGSDGSALAMAFCPGLPLKRCLAWAGDVFPATERHAVLAGVLDAVAYLHAQQVSHNDIHPGNVIVDLASPESRVADSIKLIDFGSARRGVDNEEALDEVNQAILPPPERAESWNGYSNDVFALGLLAVGLVTRRQVAARSIFRGGVLHLRTDVEASNAGAFVVLLLGGKDPGGKPPLACAALSELPLRDSWHVS